jgi:hypothetical protein
MPRIIFGSSFKQDATILISRPAALHPSLRLESRHRSRRHHWPVQYEQRDAIQPRDPQVAQAEASSVGYLCYSKSL